MKSISQVFNEAADWLEANPFVMATYEGQRFRFYNSACRALQQILPMHAYDTEISKEDWYKLWNIWNELFYQDNPDMQEDSCKFEGYWWPATVDFFVTRVLALRFAALFTEGM